MIYLLDVELTILKRLSARSALPLRRLSDALRRWLARNRHQRTLESALARLADTSPHLLEDVGFIDDNPTASGTGPCMSPGRCHFTGQPRIDAARAITSKTNTGDGRIPRQKLGARSPLRPELDKITRKYLHSITSYSSPEPLTYSVLFERSSLQYSDHDKLLLKCL